jgi:hypothetical protein
MLVRLPPEITVGREPGKPEYRAAVQGVWEVRVRRPDTVVTGREVSMKTVLGLTMLGAMVAGCTGVAMLGWAYEGPRRFIHRLRLRRAVLQVDKLRGQR